jgi:hypothetical protein
MTTNAQTAVGQTSDSPPTIEAQIAELSQNIFSGDTVPFGSWQSRCEAIALGFYTTTTLKATPDRY